MTMTPSARLRRPPSSPASGSSHLSSRPSSNGVIPASYPPAANTDDTLALEIRGISKQFGRFPALRRWGAFVTEIVSFLILAFIVFLMVRWATRLMKKPEDAPAGQTEVELLTEIRDELRRR